MRSMDCYPKAAMERASSTYRSRHRRMCRSLMPRISAACQVILFAIACNITSCTFKGYDRLLDRRRGKPSRRRVPLATVEKVLALYREKYFDLNVQHFHEKLQAEHGIELSDTNSSGFSFPSRIAAYAFRWHYNIWGSRNASPPMPDPLYLSLWFPDFSGPAMLPHLFAILQQFPFSAQRPGITYTAVQPISWNEASVLERRFSPGITPEEAVVVAADLVHDDYAYLFEAYWDLWTPDRDGQQWLSTPSLVKFIVQGEEFDEGSSQETGHIEIDFGLDSLFVQENVALTEETQAKLRDNLAKLVEFTKKAEMNTRATSRRLWSESEESLPQKLIARLQKVQ